MNEILPSDLQEEEPSSGKPGRGLALLALLLSLLAAGGTGWLFWQDYTASGEQEARFDASMVSMEQQLSKLDERVSAVDTKVSGLTAANPDVRIKNIEQELAGLRDATRDWKTFQSESSAWTHTMQAVIEGNQARLAGAEARLTALSAREMNGSTELDLAEIDYVLRLAQERLQLFGDTRTAAQALAIADQHLSGFDNPLYLGLQREIASAQQALLQAAAIDYPTVYRSVDKLQNDIGSLPFKGAEVPAEIAQASEDAGWWARIRSAFSGLVTVRRQTSEEKDLPVLADQEVIRQHAWLELEVARLAAMRRDQDAWAASLNRFSATLDKWFEPGSPAMGEVKKLLAEVQSINVDPPLPDISAPWVALQAVRAAGISAPAASAPAIPESNPESSSESSPEPEPEPEPGTGDSGQ